MGPGQWYTLHGSHSDKEIYILSQAGADIRLLGTSESVPQFDAIDLDGVPHQVSALDVDRPGIGRLTLQDAADWLTEEWHKVAHTEG